MSIYRRAGPPLAAFWALMSCSAVDAVERSYPNPACEGAAHVGRTIEIDPDGGRVDDLLDAKEVLLTFDDGPHPERTPAMLDLLYDNCITGVFFLRGDMATQYPGLVRRIVAEGHILGGHGVKHDRLTDLSPEAARKDIEDSLDDIAQAFEDPVAVRPHLYRFTYFATNNDLSGYVRSRGLLEVGANAGAGDWGDQTAEAAVDKVMWGLDSNDDRGIILLHDPFRLSHDIASQLIELLISEEFRFVSPKMAE